jgi:hypothetical protein
VQPGDRDALEKIIRLRGGFSHREHLELAWTYLDRYPFERAYEAVAAAVRHVARLHGAPDRYHETLTRAWLLLVAVHRSWQPGDSFDEFIAAHPRLLDRTLLNGHYTHERLMSPQAREAWTEPDLRPLPAVG